MNRSLYRRRVVWQNWYGPPTCSRSLVNMSDALFPGRFLFSACMLLRQEFVPLLTLLTGISTRQISPNETRLPVTLLGRFVNFCIYHSYTVRAGRARD